MNPTASPSSLHAGEPSAVAFSGSRRLCRLLAWLLLAACCALWCYVLGARTLIPTDESRYAEIAREMTASGDFISQRLNGIQYYGKPPLQAWMTALTFQAFGLGEWQARLWTGLCGLFGIAMVTYTGWRLFGRRAGLFNGLVLASSLYWIAAGHISSLDMGLAAMMTLALCALLLAQRDDASDGERRNYMLLCWAGLGLAMMSKGLIGVVLPGAVLVVYALLTRDFAIWKRLHVIAGLPVFFAITLQWFVAMSVRNPEFLHFFFIREHFQRFSSNVHLRQAPWHYYLPYLLGGVLPWLGVCLQSLRAGWGKAAGRFQPDKLLLVWAVFIFCFFSIAKGKLPSYILPVFPAIAMLIGHYLDKAPRRDFIIAAALTVVVGVVMLGMAWHFPRRRDPAEVALYHAYVPWIVVAGMSMLTGGILAIRLSAKMRTAAVVSIALAGFVSGHALLLGHEPFGRNKAGLEHLDEISAEIGPDTAIYSVGAYEYSLPFYLRRTMTMVEHAEDGMVLGLQKEPQLWIPQREDFVREWMKKRSAGNKAIAVMRPDIHAQLQKDGVPMRVIARDARRIVVANDAR
ncbi:4-amino-4-deoxy-L-arabinose transferase-like glycosyltransferase [Paucimonas lemoignei]|uniref:4-amino-4-deoxy-L-arabinose transferase-like glycosyltransferase n=1 Tax=Paucimonas lemoignei TaxID=29443 RepID=A0A4R3HVY4_PAULE|nr:glycosyltransferase family 39 protein [Paucimonas lemoignei]TCS37427.1 4-amino-4-deoxy-L-arabinose transferase-like glycosyltransferase [Paucimonas lemoignei]